MPKLYDEYTILIATVITVSKKLKISIVSIEKC